MTKKLYVGNFIKKSNIIHNGIYDYSKVEYVNNRTKVTIICKTHGEFNQIPTNHLKGCGCPKCNGGVKYNILELKQKLNKQYNGKYEYKFNNYNSIFEKVNIFCKLHKNVFKIPLTKHIQGQECPLCSKSISKLEIKLEKYLTSNNIKFIKQKRFKWLGKLVIDFYLPNYNIAIECQGRQHFQEVDIFGGYESLKKQIELDKKKNNLCITHNIKLLYLIDKKYNLDNLSYIDFYNKTNLFNNIEQLIDIIKNNGG